jgi:hypothetical protein
LLANLVRFVDRHIPCKCGGVKKSSPSAEQCGDEMADDRQDESGSKTDV